MGSQPAPCPSPVITYISKRKRRATGPLAEETPALYGEIVWAFRSHARGAAGLLKALKKAGGTVHDIDFPGPYSETEGTVLIDICKVKGSNPQRFRRQ